MTFTGSGFRCTSGTSFLPCIKTSFTSMVSGYALWKGVHSKLVVVNVSITESCTTFWGRPASPSQLN